MKNTRTRLIKQAQTDPADEGTEWRDRVDRWLGLDWEAQGLVDPRMTPTIGSAHFWTDHCEWPAGAGVTMTQPQYMSYLMERRANV